MNDDVEYWRELAARYQRELEALRARVLRYLESPADNAAALLCAAKAQPGWLEEIDRIDAELKATDVRTALGDLWDRVARDE
ncbi:MAG TPA: hypothetical protein VKB93_13365 [Thermoanaerobaculia bacterium]|nr:hypothetical protein [Thermoanaerobaculia bacterium]